MKIKLTSGYQAIFLFPIFAAIAFAQTQPLACSANQGLSTLNRAEGLAELVGDEVITCTGGTPTANGTAMPQVNIEVFLNVNVTSRITSTGLTEALLMIDEPAPANQHFCAAPPCSDVGNGTGQGVYTSQTNIFPGSLYSASTILFFGIPIDPPGGTNQRTIRITNIRVNANQLGVSSSTLIPSPITMSVTVVPNMYLPVWNPLQQASSVQWGLGPFGVRLCDGSADTVPRFDQAVSQNSDLYTGNSTTGSMQFALKFKENFNTAFETMLAAGQDPSTPGTLYSSESGFVNTNVLGTQIGFATQGTRLMARFSGIPTGIRLFVTTVPLNASSSKAGAGLIAGTDANGAGGSVASSTGTATSSLTGETKPIAEVILTNGAGMAVWEVTSDDPNNTDSLLFGVAVAYQANQPGLGTVSILGGLGPLSTSGASTATDPAPRFADTATSQPVFVLKSSSTSPTTPVLLSPANGAQQVPITQALSWSFDSSADSNDVYLGTSPNPPLVGNTTLGSFSPGTLNAGTVYYWKVVSKNSFGSTASLVWSFTTQFPPTAPTLVSPANGTPNVSLEPALTWGAVSNADSYCIGLSTSPTPPCMYPTTSTSYTPELPNNTTYYWQITAYNAAGSASSAVWSFTTTTTPLPDAPVLVSPADGATGVSTTASLTWSAANNAASYDVYFGPSYPPPFVTNTTGTGYNPGTLGSSPKYYWQVVARNVAGSTSSGLFSFTTQQQSALQLIQQGSKLVGSGAVNWGNLGAEQGWSVAVSADGNTAIVGGPDDNPAFGKQYGAGAAWVYTRTGGLWTQQGNKLVGTGAVTGEEFGVAQGWSVALSADGNTALVGGPYDGYDQTGAAWVFTRSGGVWTQQGDKLVGTGAVGNAYQGYSVALSADGNTAIVGGWGFGAAWVFTRSEGVWTQQGNKLVGTGAGGDSDQGSSVALSADGDTAVVGGPLDLDSHGNASGAAWVFARAGGVWTQQGNKLVGTGATGYATQGQSVALAADGNTAVVGGPADGAGGATWVYTRSGGAWTQQGSKLVGSGAVENAEQGYSVALSADGNTAVVGGPGDNGSVGAAWVFVGGTAPPTVTTSAATSVAASTAALNGSVNPMGLDTQVWFLYSTNSSMTGAASTPSQDIGSGTVGVPVTANLTGLAASTPYYFQAVAQNSVGTVQGSVLSFTTTGPPPTVTTSGATSITSSTATLPGSVNPNGSDTQVWFLYSTNSSMSGALSTSQRDIGSSTVAVPVSAGVSSLNGQTTYYFQAVAQNNGGITQGPILSFTTAIPPPTVTTLPAATITSTSATLTGNLSYIGVDTQVWFLYGTNSSMNGAASTPQQDIASADGDRAVFCSGISGLAPNTIYYYQAVAQNSAGISQGSVLTFTTAGLQSAFFAQQGSKLAGAGGLGLAVALSADGNTALVGAPYDNNAIGAARVYTRSGGEWTQQAQLVGTGAAGSGVNQGWSVALSADGNTAVVGGPWDNNETGAAWIFARSGIVWTQQGSKLVGTGAVGPANQGMSVALSGDGNTAILGGPSDNSNAGASWVFTRSEGVWTQQGSKLVGSGAVGAAQQGSSVALSGDGNTAIVGGPCDNENVDCFPSPTIGAAWVFGRSEGVWTQQGSKLVGTGAVGDARQGSSVAMSTDGNTAIVGGPWDNGGIDPGIGAAWVYTRAGSVWIQQGSKLVGAGAAGTVAGQGDSVALSADGNTAMVGGSDDGGLGAAWMYTRSAGTWSQWGSKLVGAGSVGEAAEGSAVALSGDGLTAIMGGYCDNDFAGAAWVFTSPRPTKIGTYNTGQWYLDTNGNGTWDGPPDVAGTFGAGLPGAIYVTGDWNGSGHTKMGVFYQGFWYLDFKGDGTWDGGVIDKQYNFGWNDPNVIPVVGDWNGDGRTKIGIYYQGFWYLDYDGNGVWDGGVNDKAYNFGWPATGVTPMVGDWSGTGTAKIGVYYYGFWYLDYDGDGVWNPANDKAYTFGWNATGVTPIQGDWNGDGRAKIGIYYYGFWYLDYDGNGVWDGGVNDKQYNLGWSDPAVKPVIGDWSGGGTAKIGVFYNGYWYLDYIGNGIWDGGIVDKAYVWGQPGDTPVVGKW
jgi:hypothetical protein